jgi:hypothetical protein
MATNSGISVRFECADALQRLKQLSGREMLGAISNAVTQGLREGKTAAADLARQRYLFQENVLMKAMQRERVSPEYAAQGVLGVLKASAARTRR